MPGGFSVPVPSNDKRLHRSPGLDYVMFVGEVPQLPSCNKHCGERPYCYLRFENDMFEPEELDALPVMDHEV